VIAVAAPHLGFEQLLARLQWSPGTEAAEEATFEPGGRIARAGWRAGLGPCDHVRLGPAADAASTVAVVPIPGDLVQALRALAGDRARPALAQAMAPFLSAMPASVGWRLAGEPLHAGLSVGPIGLAHTTVDGRTDRHVGLHFDSWDRLPPLDRARGSNRLCVNVGAGSRHLLFVPMSAAAIVGALAARQIYVLTDEAALRDSTGRCDLARRYLEVFPDQPVLRLRVLPGEAYVAPTENLIHDGSSEEAVDRDISVTVRGFFVPRAAA
jgi:hypothetical protein